MTFKATVTIWNNWRWPVPEEDDAVRPQLHEDFLFEFEFWTLLVGYPFYWDGVMKWIKR
jgi:hypothetical protein